MRNLLHTLVMLIIVFPFIVENIKEKNITSKVSQVDKQQIDSLLYGIEDKINNSLNQCFISKSDEKLIDLSIKLNNLSTETKQRQIITYWSAYLNYYLAIYYISKKDKTLSEKSIVNGIELLNNISNKNSEDLALLALMQGFSIQFNFMKAMIISKKSNENATKSIQLNSSNLRGYFVLANNDFYSPWIFGGGKKVEQYLLKSISLPNQKVLNKSLPSWGKKESYELLVKFYFKKERWKEAKKYLQEGLASYPQSYTLKHLASKLNDK